MTALKTNLGRITQIIGPVIDVTFSPKKLPNIYNSLEITAKDESGNDVKIVAEVQQLLGDNLVRAVSMSNGWFTTWNDSCRYWGSTFCTSR